MLIILDRDGVINEESHEFIKSPEEWRPIPGSLKAIAKLKQAGHQVAVATNQSGIARGLYSETMLTSIHNKMKHALAEYGASLDFIAYCPHLDQDQCVCRKPRAGMYIHIADVLKCELRNTICIGDSLRDIQAALAVNAKPILVLTGNGPRTLTDLHDIPVPHYSDLLEAVTHILGSSGNY